MRAIAELLGIHDRSTPTDPKATPPTVTLRWTLNGPPADYVSPYMPYEMRDVLLVPDAEGLPPLKFTKHQGQTWLAERTTGQLVNVGNSHLRKLGIWSCRIRGDKYQDTKAVQGRGELVREPDNPYDPNAVAIYVNGGKVGYFDRGMAKTLAKAMDTGAALEALIISDSPPKVIAAEPRIIRHLSG